ncbi:MAG TPA: alkaline phosphatase family protein [Chthoniobacterales bacterium]|nr:alkaline phosphatase family protein [Chthoniobacterales bacterium]
MTCRLTLLPLAGVLWFAQALLAGSLPHPDHVVVVIFENKSFGQIIGNPGAPNINALAAEGANIVNSAADPGAATTGSHALRHPSQPNYLELFSGSNQGVVSNGRPGTVAEPSSPPLPFNTPNLGAALIANGYSFAIFSESLPSTGFDGDFYSTEPGQNQYERKHNPAVNWQAPDAPANNHLPPSANQPFVAFPKDAAGYAALPTVTFVVPNEQNNMHDGSITRGDGWLKTNILDGYYQWAKTHNSLLIVTFDEDASNTPSNQITTIFAGALIQPGDYPETNINPPDARPAEGYITPTGTAMNHYNLLRTLEDMFGLPTIGGSINTPAVTDIFRPPSAKLLNSSTRLRAGTGDDVLIAGFIVGGPSKKQVIVRGLGPSLQVAGALADPAIDLRRSDGTTVAANNDWQETQQAELAASGLAPDNERESAIAVALDPGSYTVVLSGQNNTAGVALVEVYDVDGQSTPRLLNLSTRGRVQTGDNVMIAGVILGGTDYARLIFRGLGPSIAVNGTPLPARLSDPILELHDGNGTLIRSNDDWKEAQSAEIQMSGLAPHDDREAAIIANFAPGKYTAILRGKNNTSGTGLVEVYKLN